MGMAVEKIGSSEKESVHLFFSDAELQSYLFDQLDLLPSFLVVDQGKQDHLLKEEMLEQRGGNRKGKFFDPHRSLDPFSEFFLELSLIHI